MIPVPAEAVRNISIAAGLDTHKSEVPGYSYGGRHVFHSIDFSQFHNFWKISLTRIITFLII